MGSKAWDMWLDCNSDREISVAMDIPDRTVSEWLREKRNFADFAQAPESRQHFDVWQFATADYAGTQNCGIAYPA